MKALNAGFKCCFVWLTFRAGLKATLGLALLLGMAAGVFPVEAATKSWSKTASDPLYTDFTNTANWVGASIPGETDTALFTNKITGRMRIGFSSAVTNAEALFDYSYVTFYYHFLTNANWAVTSRFAVAVSTPRTNNVVLMAGVLNVTNADRTAVMDLGSSVGLSGFTVWGGTANVDRLTAMKAGSAFGYNPSVFSGGELNIFVGSDIATTNVNAGSNITLNNTRLNLLAGTHMWYLAFARSLVLGAGAVARVTGTGTVWSVNHSVISGIGNNDRLVVENGAWMSITNFGLSWGAGASNPENYAPDGKGSVSVLEGALLQVNTIYTGTNGTGSLTVSNAVLEFTVAAPVIVPKTPGTIVMTNGTISYLGANNVDVKANWGASLTNIQFQGANTLRLNGATNLNAASQAYTFGLGGATNYTRLELMNGAFYRGGHVTIGDGGTLAVPEGVGTVSSNLTFQAGGALELRVGPTGTSTRVKAGRDVALGGAGLTLRLTAAPEKDYAYVLIQNDGANPVSGNFASSDVSASFEDKTYVFTIRTNGGDGNDVTARSSSKGTVVQIR